MNQEWEKLPTKWIKDGGLKKFMWSGSEKANFIAALITYILLVQKNKNGLTQITYSEICETTNISREKIAKAIALLVTHRLIEKKVDQKNGCYKIASYNAPPWGKIPIKGLFNKEDHLTPFFKFHLRSKNELNALKLYLLIASFRDKEINAARLSYDRITQYTGIQRNDIRQAISLLINIDLISLDNVENSHEYGTSNRYRLKYVDSYRHRGTAGRSDSFKDAVL